MFADSRAKIETALIFFEKLCVSSVKLVVFLTGITFCYGGKSPSIVLDMSFVDENSEEKTLSFFE